MSPICNFGRNLRFSSYCNPGSSQFKKASGWPPSLPSSPRRQWCPSTLYVEMRHRETKWLYLGQTEIPRQRTNDHKVLGSNAVVLGQHSSPFCLCSIPAAQSVWCLSSGLFSALLRKWRGKLSSERSLWNLVQEPGGQSEKQCCEAKLKQDLQCCVPAVAWGCCLVWDASPEDLSQLPEAALIGEYDCGSKSRWSWLLGYRSCDVALGELPLGKAFFSTTDFSETWFRPSVISFALHWLLLCHSKWWRGKGQCNGHELPQAIAVFLSFLFAVIVNFLLNLGINLSASIPSHCLLWQFAPFVLFPSTQGMLFIGDSS